MTGGPHEQADPQTDEQAPHRGDDEPWLRLDARIIVAVLARALIRLVPAALAWLFFGDADGFATSSLVVLAVIAVVSPAQQALRYLTLRYRVDGSELQVRSGLLFRSSRRIPLHRIRTVDVTAPLLQRLLGLAVLVVGTGENMTSELGTGVTLDGLRAPVAAALRSTFIQASTAAAPGTVAPAPGTAPAPELVPVVAAEPEPVVAAATGAADGDVVARLRWRWIRFHLVGVWLFVGPVAVLGSAWGIASSLGLEPGGIVERHVVEGRLDRLPIAVAATVVVLALVLIGVAAAVVTFVEAWWGYRLVDEGGGRFVALRGLLTDRSFTADRDRMRGVTLRESLPMRALGGARLALVLTGVSLWQELSEISVVLPAADRIDAARTAARLLGDDVLGDERRRPGWFVRHPPAARRRALVRPVGLALLVVAGLTLLAARGTSWWVPAGVALVLLPLAVLDGLGSYRNLGHRLDGDWIHLRRGFLLVRTDVVQVRGINGATVSQTVFQRRLGLATLLLSTAAGEQGYRAIDLDLADATRLAALLVDEPSVDPACTAPLPADLTA